MENITFQHDPQIGPEKFILKEGTVVIVGGVGLSKERVIRLTDISSDYEQGHRLFHRSYLVPIVLAGITGAVSWWLFTRGDSMGASMVAVITAGMAVAFLLLMKFTPVEFARFRDTRGQLLIEVYRSRKVPYKFDEFVSELVRRIKAEQKEQD